MNKPRSGGAVLILAMIFLLLMALVAGTVMQTSILEFRMAGNDQFREEAFQKAQGIAAAISADQDNFPVSGGVGYIICEDVADTTKYPDCGESLAVLDPDVLSVPSGVTFTYQVQREGPAFLDSLPFRLAQGSTSSSLAYDAAIFEAHVQVDGGSVGLGSAEIVEGLAIVIVSSAQ